ncbi:MAG: alpha/beta fold hydrolase [bacterium]
MNREFGVIIFTLVLVILVGLVVYTRYSTWQLEQKYPPRGRFIEFDGSTIHYTKKGEGHPLVLLHGASSNSLDYESSIGPVLAKIFQVIVIDRPGLGHSTRKNGKWLTPLDQANLVREVLRKENIEQPVLVGHSWSAALVLSYLLHYPSEVAAAVLITPATHSWDSPPALYNRISRIPLIGTLLAYTAVLPFGRHFVDEGIKSVFFDGEIPKSYRRKTGTDLLLRPHSWLANADDLSLLNQYLKYQEQFYDWIKHPMLAIIGDHDKVVSNEIHTDSLSQQAKHLEVVELPQMGHAPHHSAPDSVVSSIVSFVHRLKKAA